MKIIVNINDQKLARLPGNCFNLEKKKKEKKKCMQKEEGDVLLKQKINHPTCNACIYKTDWIGKETIM